MRRDSNVSLYPSIVMGKCSWRAVDPLYFLMGFTFLYKYQGILFATSVLNGDGGMFLMAICVCRSENGDN